MSEPDVASYRGMVADGNATENRGVGIDSDRVFDDGVARHIKHVALLVVFEILRSEGDTLIESDMVANDTGLADDDTSAMVNGEIFADGGSRMDVDAGLGVSQLGDDAGDDRDT